MKKPILSFLAGFTVIFLMALTTDQIIQKVYDSANTALRVNVVTGGSGGTVTGSGASTQVAYWTSASALAGDAGMTYIAATDDLVLGGIDFIPSVDSTSTDLVIGATAQGGGFELYQAFEVGDFDAQIILTPPSGTGTQALVTDAVKTGDNLTPLSQSLSGNIRTTAGMTNGLYIGTIAGNLHFFSGGFATANEHMRVLGTGGHYETSGTAPAVSNTSANSCGTTAASIVGNDHAGKVTVGATSGTSCTVTFATAYTNAPACVAIDETTAVLTKAISTTSTVIISGVFTAADKLAYNCQGYY